MIEILSRIWLVAEPIVMLLLLCALGGGMIGLVYGLIAGFLGDEDDHFRRRYFLDDDRD